MKWDVLDSKRQPAARNMALDQELLKSLQPDSPPLIHFYEWERPSATYGYFINPFDYLNEEAVNVHGIELARRPTGGGIIFHFSDFAFSLLVPSSHPNFSINTEANYAYVNEKIAEAIRLFLNDPALPLTLLKKELCGEDEASSFFCMAKPTVCDIMLREKKVGGGAQRRTKNGFLHQGTISLFKPDEFLLKDLLKPETCVFQAMKKNSGLLLDDQKMPSSQITDQLKKAISCSLNNIC